MKIPFDIKYRPQIESGEYKVYAKEHEEVEVRIICWDNKGKYPIVALVDDEPEMYDIRGRLAHYEQDSSQEFNLFVITPEPELTEFEQSVVNTIENELNHTSDDGSASFGVSIDNETAKVLAKELLDLARKELSRSGNIVLSIEDFEKRHIEAQEVGRKEALKDLPRWKTVKDREGISQKIPYVGTNIIGEKTLYVGYKCISVNNLETLPGFKED